MKYIKLSIHRKTHRISMQVMSYFDTKKENSDVVSRTYPVTDKAILLPIMSKDIELIFYDELNSFKKIYEGSVEYQGLEEMFDNLVVEDGTDIDELDLEEVLVNKTTYYFRRYIKEHVKNKEPRDYKQNGFSICVYLSEIVDAKKALPRDFILLQKEFSEIIKILRRYLPIQEHIKVRLEGDINYTKQYISEFLFETANPTCADYFVGCFKKESNLSSFKDTLNYEPFIDRIEVAISEVKSTDINQIYKYLFNHKLKESKYQSPFDSLYMYVSNKILVPPIEEEKYYLNKDYATYSNLPDQFLLDGNIVVKETFKENLSTFVSPTSIDTDFLSIGETIWRAKLTTDGFLLDARNLFGVNLDYIEDNYNVWFKKTKTITKITQTMTVDNLIRSVNRYMSQSNSSTRFTELIRASLNPMMDDTVYYMLMYGIRQEFQDKAGAENIFRFLESSIYGEMSTPTNQGGLFDGFETA